MWPSVLTTGCKVLWQVTPFVWLQGQVALSEPAAGVSQGMLIADPQTLNHLQALVQQQQAMQGWHNASNLIQALQMQQQLQAPSASSMGEYGRPFCPGVVA